VGVPVQLPDTTWMQHTMHSRSLVHEAQHHSRTASGAYTTMAKGEHQNKHLRFRTSYIAFLQPQQHCGVLSTEQPLLSDDCVGRHTNALQSYFSSAEYTPRQFPLLSGPGWSKYTVPGRTFFCGSGSKRQNAERVCVVVFAISCVV